jgi:hypothetical protein
MSESHRSASGEIGRRVTASVMLGLFANLVACTEYTPVRSEIDAAGQPEVRVTLTDQGRVDAAPKVGLRATTLTGSLQSMTDSSISMTVRRVSREGGIEDNYDGLQLSLNPNAFESVEKSRTSVSRSLLLTAAIVLGSFLLVKGIGDVTGSSDTGPPGSTK